MICASYPLHVAPGVGVTTCLFERQTYLVIEDLKKETCVTNSAGTFSRTSSALFSRRRSGR